MTEDLKVSTKEEKMNAKPKKSEKKISSGSLKRKTDMLVQVGSIMKLLQNQVDQVIWNLVNKPLDPNPIKMSMYEIECRQGTHQNLKEVLQCLYMAIQMLREKGHRRDCHQIFPQMQIRHFKGKIEERLQRLTIQVFLILNRRIQIPHGI